MESRSLSHLPPGEPKSCGVMLHIIGNTDKAAAEKAAAVKAAAEKAAAVKIAAIMATADKAAADKAAADKAAADKAAADKAAADKAAKENDAGEKATGSKETGSPSKVLTSMPEEEEEDDEWDNFSKTEMKVLIKEVELRKEALFGDYKEGESPKYRWLIWQEVAEKVNEVNPCIHRNLEQVRIKWFDYKDPTNKWERRVKKKAYKHTTGMFFKRRTNSLATCPAGDSDGDQSSAENKNVDKANDPQGEEGKSGPAPQSTSQQGKFAQVDEATKVKGVLSTLNADKAKRAIRYLSHLSQRHGMAMVQPKSAPKEASPNQSHSIEEVTVVEDDEPEKEAASDRKKPEDETESVINPPKKTYSRPRSDPAMGALKLVLGGDSDAVNSCALLKTRGGMYSCDQKEADLVSPKDPNTASGVKRPAKGMDVASTPESKRMMFGSSGSNVAALLKTVDPSKVQQIHMKHPKTGKDMVVTKISAPEAMVALGNKISRVKLLNEDSKSNPSAESKKATLSPTTAKPSPNPAANLAVDSNTIAVGQQIVTGQKVITNAKVLGAKDSKGSFPLLVPVGAIKQVTNSSNLLIKHPVTGKGIIISKVLQAPLTSAAPVKPTVTTVAAPIGLAPTVGSRDSTGKAVVPGGGKLISGLPLVNVVTTIQPSTSTSSVVTVSKNQDVDSCSEKLKTSELASPESLDVTVKKSLDGTKMESNSDASAVGGESAMETDCESTVVVGEESSGMLDLPDGNEEEATLAPSRENTVEMKADNSGLGETIQPTVFNMENKGKQVTKSSSTVALGDTAINKSPIQEVINDLFPKMKDPGMSDVGSQEVDARLFEEKKSAVTVPTTVAKSQPTAEKEEKVSETKFLQTVKTSVAGVLKPLPLQTEDLAQQILRGVGGSMKISAQGQASGSMPAKWESGGVRMLNIGGKTVKVVLVKDEDYCKMMGKSKVSVIKPSQSVMTVVPDVEEKPHKDMPLIEILNKQSETVGKVGGKMGPGDVVKNSPNQGTAVDASSKAIQATPIQGHTPSTPVKEHKAILGFPPSPTSAPMGILGTPVGNLLTTSTTSSPSMTVVTMPQRVVSMDCPQNPVIKAGLRKPNILSSSTRTVASSSGMISVVAGSSPSNFGVKRALPTSIQATTSKLKVRVVKDEGMCKELEKTQHPLVKAALSGKPIDFQEELKKLDSLEDTTRSEVGDFAEGKDVSGVPARNVSQDKKDNAIGDKNRKNPLSEPGNPPETGVSPSVTSDHAYIGVKTGAPKDKPLLNISGPSPSGGSIRVRSTESLQNIRIASNVVSKKISLSHIAVLNSGSPRGPLNALGVRNDQASIVSRGKRKQELVVNKLSVGAKVARNFKSGLVRNPTNMEVMRDVDDCVIVEEVITRSMDPPEVFCVDSNDSYGVEVS